jgi:NAD(P)-dependent dehydrogenase (short-subunit alcohol dehydrogenase family)
MADQTPDPIFAAGLLRDRVAFITGGGTGIGFGIAVKLGRLGARVAICGRRTAVLEQAVQQLKALGVPAMGVTVDVRQYEMVSAAIASTVAEFGGLDILVNNAAGNFVKPTEELSPNGWKAPVDIDLNGTFHCCRAAFPHLAASPHVGRIINIITAYAWMGWPGCAPAAAAKAGIQSLTRTLAVEWGRKNILVNSIAPGPIDQTEGTRRIHEQTGRAALEREKVAVGRFGDVEDIANATAYLVSPAGSYITGADLVVDGGRQFKTVIVPPASA